FKEAAIKMVEPQSRADPCNDEADQLIWLVRADWNDSGGMRRVAPGARRNSGKATPKVLDDRQFLIQQDVRNRPWLVCGVEPYLGRAYRSSCFDTGYTCQLGLTGS